jgi:uncharacterized protein YjbI with pentapeptide repeats
MKKISYKQLLPQYSSINIKAFVSSIKLLKQTFSSMNLELKEFNLGMLKLIKTQIRKNQQLIDNMIKIVQLSRLAKRDSQLAHNAAAAISILNFARIPFSGIDFSNINIPFADLSFSLFHLANLRNASLVEVNLVGSIMEQAELENADLTDAKMT